MKIYSDKALNLPSQWFTGREWFNGTAEDYFLREYKQASAEMEIEERQHDFGEPIS